MFPLLPKIAIQQNNVISRDYNVKLCRLVVV